MRKYLSAFLSLFALLTPIAANSERVFDSDSNSSYYIGKDDEFAISFHPDINTCILIMAFKEDNPTFLNYDSNTSENEVLVQFQLSNGEVFAIPAIFHESGNSQWLFDIGTATYSSEVEEIGNGYNEWSTMKYINSRLKKFDIASISMAVFSPDREMISQESYETTPDTARKMKRIFEEISEDMKNQGEEYPFSFHTYEWE